MYKTILLPVDLREASSWKRALPHALDLAQRHAARLHLLTVVPDVGLSVVAQFVPKDYAARAVQEARHRLAEFAQTNLPDGTPHEVHASEGSIYGEILKLAEELKADLIVMASHRPELKDYLLGPNAARVVRHARCSVLVVRE
jgi:nucleotide-binding universal stress UspA family protein